MLTDYNLNNKKNAIKTCAVFSFYKADQWLVLITYV